MFPQPFFCVVIFPSKKKKSRHRLFLLFLPRYLLFFYFHLIVSKLKARPCANAVHCWLGATIALVWLWEDKCAVVQTSLGWQSPWTPTRPGGELKYYKLYSNIKAALKKFEEWLGLTAKEAISHAKMSRTCLRLKSRPPACCTSFSTCYYSAAREVRGPFPGFPENLKPFLFCNTCGI